MRDPRTGLEIPDMGDIPIPGSSFDVGNNSSTTKMNGAMPPPAATPPPVAAQAAAQAVQSVPRATIPAAAAPAPAPMAPAPSMADVLSQARGMSGQLYGQYSPENRNALYLAMLEKRGGMGNAVGAGLASVGDAIARGYGRSQTDFLDKSLQSEQDTVKQGLDAFDTNQKAELAAVGQGMELQKMDAGSALSKMTQEAFAGPLEKLGYSKDMIAKMPASQIESVTQVALKYADIASQKELKEATIQLQTMIANANAGNQRLQRMKDVSDTQRAAAEAALKRGENARVLGIPIPFTSDISSKTRQQAQKVFENQMSTAIAGAEHPQASAAEKWALENPSDPRSAEILKRLGK